MKKLSLITSLITMIILAGCRDRVIQKMTYTANVPVYMSYEDLRTSIQSKDPQSIEISGKIYLYKNYLLINDYLKGIHVFDNSDRANPKALKFLNIPGNIDLAVKNDILYVDSYIDLVALDISDLSNIKEVNRYLNAFSYKVPFPKEDYKVAKVDQDLGVVVDYEISEVTERTEIENEYYYIDCWNCDVMRTMEFSSGLNSSGASSAASGSSGIAGSMAGFALVGEYLYSIDQSEIKTFKISDLSLSQTQESNRVLETIFPYGDKLFFGTTSGMLIYDISSPANPSFFSNFNHAESCDPVVVQGNHAYVTLRTGNRCGGWSNQMDIINIEDLSNPVLESSMDMNNPHGLGIDGQNLFVCDGDAGLKVYTATEFALTGKVTVTHKKTYSTITALDVIPDSNILIMIAEEGIYQYDYSDINNIILLSTINI